MSYSFYCSDRTLCLKGAWMVYSILQPVVRRAKKLREEAQGRSLKAESDAENIGECYVLDCFLLPFSTFLLKASTNTIPGIAPAIMG